MSRSTDRQNCDVVHQLVEAFVDGDLGPAEERMVATHVDGCETCARELRTAREVRSALRSLPEHDAPATVLWAVRMATRDDSATAPVPAGSARWMRRPATAVTTAAVAAALMVATVVWWQRPATGPSLDDPEIARAVRETRFALGLVGALGRRAALDEVLGRRVVAPAVDGVKAVLLEHRGAESSADGRTESQPIADKGVDG